MNLYQKKIIKLIRKEKEVPFPFGWGDVNLSYYQLRIEIRRSVKKFGFKHFGL